MSEFTLFSVLNSIKKNLLVTAIIFIASYLLLPSSNILENRFSMQKTINLGKYVPGHQFDFLNYHRFHLQKNGVSNHLGIHRCQP